MRDIAITALLATALAGLAPAQGASSKPAKTAQNKSAPVDDFKREGDAKKRARQDPLEGKAPPALSVNQWMNTNSKALNLSKLKGKVIAIKFWGVW